MRTVLLTMDMPAGARCARALAEACELAGILVQSAPPAVPFDTAHELDDAQRSHETETWFAGKVPAMADLAPSRTVADMSSAEAVEALDALAPDVVVVLGPAAVGPAIMRKMGSRIILLHCGDPQDYRGYDAHLWAVYHGDHIGLQAVVQYAHTDANAGSVLHAQEVDITSDMALHQLHQAAVDTAIHGMMKVLSFFHSGGMLSVNRLQRLGKVYTPMPAVLKGYCADRFRASLRP